MKLFSLIDSTKFVFIVQSPYLVFIFHLCVLSIVLFSLLICYSFESKLFVLDNHSDPPQDAILMFSSCSLLLFSSPLLWYEAPLPFVIVLPSIHFFCSLPRCAVFLLLLSVYGTFPLWFLPFIWLCVFMCVPVSAQFSRCLTFVFLALFALTPLGRFELYLM